MLAEPVTNKHRLVIFSDDWGRHPSSCQHIARRLVTRYPILWVNTIGMRSPTLGREDLGKAWRKVRSWMKTSPASDAPGATESRTSQQVVPANMRVINPRMWPGFRASWQRRLNAKLMASAVNDALGPREAGEIRTAITTLPITADLPGKLDVDQWVYYCVDDFSLWPGLDATAMRDMERDQLAKMDHVAAVSQNLMDRLTSMGAADVSFLTHGIDLGHWQQALQPSEMAQSDGAAAGNGGARLRIFFSASDRPIFLFWGLIDTRLDTAWCQAISRSGLGELVLVGPTQSPDETIASLKHVTLHGPAAYDRLPEMAREAAVLVMPYADLPVTRAMQPLKFKEYLATGKPVVARALPGIADWADAADLVNDEEALLQAIRQRLREGLPESQAIARQRLKEESWEHKAGELERLFGRDR